MADLFIPRNVSQEYDPFFWQEEMQRIASAIQELEAPWIILSPQAVEPEKRKEGMLVNADGVNWNPGAGGAGFYEYRGATWVKH